MPKMNAEKLKILEMEFANRFIETLRQDIKSGETYSRTHEHVHAKAINLIKHRDDYPDLSLEQIIRGALNLAVVSEDSKYNILKPDTIGVQKFHYFINQSTKWYVDTDSSYTENQRFISVLTKASEGPLFMMSACVSQTLALYNEYLGIIGKNRIKKLPTGFTHYYVPKSPTIDDQFVFEIVDEENQVLELQSRSITVGVTQQREKLETILNRFSDKIKALEYDKTYNVRTIAVLQRLISNLNHHKELYIEALFHDKTSTDLAKLRLVEQSASSINQAKDLLESEVGWVHSLQNLLISIVNAVISVSNTYIRTQIQFFKYNPPIVSDLVQINNEIRNNLLPIGEIECPEEFGFASGLVMQAKEGVIITETILKKVGAAFKAMKDANWEKMHYFVSDSARHEEVLELTHKSEKAHKEFMDFTRKYGVQLMQRLTNDAPSVKQEPVSRRTLLAVLGRVA